MSDWRTDWRSERAEYIAGKLLDQDDQTAFEQSRCDDGEPPLWVSDAEMVRRWADDRAAVESECAVAAELERVARWQGMWRDGAA